FTNSYEGWAVGRKLAKQPGQTDDNFILHTTDGGGEWEDLSDKLPDGSGVLKIAFFGPKAITVITADGVLFSTQDAGLTWRNVAAYKNDKTAISIHQLDLDIKNRPCLIAGAGGIEGTISMVSCLEGENTWT